MKTVAVRTIKRADPDTTKALGQLAFQPSMRRKGALV